MTILNRYLSKTTLLSIAIVLLILVSIDSLFNAVNELDEIGQGDYSFLTLLGYISFTIPKSIYIYYPIATLLGILIGLGSLANNFELTVMRASGISIPAIIWSAFKPALLLTLIMLLCAEWLLPASNNAAESLRFKAKYETTSQAQQHNLWLRTDEDIVHIKSAVSATQLNDILRFHIRAPLTLHAITYAEQALYFNQKWHLSNIHQMYFDQYGTVHQTYPSTIWKTSIEPKHLQFLKFQPEQLPIRILWQQKKYLTENLLDDTHFAFALWQRLFQPITIAVMLFLTIPFIFGSLRTQSIGTRVVTGIIMGFTFHLFTQVVGPLAVLYNTPPWLAALTPSIIFSGIAVFLISFKRTN